MNGDLFVDLMRGVLCCRWAKLKEALIDNRSKLGEAQTLQQFSRDADEMENWLQEKLQIAMDESYKDPSNIQVSGRCGQLACFSFCASCFR